MLKISRECIETYIAQQERNPIKYLKEIIDTIDKENPILLKKLLFTIMEFTKTVISKRDDETITDADFERMVSVNTLYYCLSVYQCINAQVEINELKELYGENTKETSESDS